MSSVSKNPQTLFPDGSIELSRVSLACTLLLEALRPESPGALADDLPGYSIRPHGSPFEGQTLVFSFCKHGHWRSGRLNDLFKVTGVMGAVYLKSSDS